jgi:hypothetical protein
MKRKRTAPAPAFDTSAYVIAWDWSASQSLNPTDAEGHTIYTGGDDACYFETPAPPPTTPQPTGSRNVDFHPVDCPPAMNDPAWDTCAGSLLRSKKTGECVCAPLVGNPPPPPTKNVCPAGKP